MFEIKKIPEDFIVREIIDLKTKDKGDYFYFLLKKKSRNTLDVINEISRKLKTKFIGYAGNKDKNALAEQYISIYKTPKEEILALKLKNAQLTFFGCGNERIHIGSLTGNEFIITIRNINKKIEKTVDKIKNYFDAQRFGINNTNHLIGKALIQKDFKKACELLNLKPNENNFIGALRTISKKQLLFYIHAYSSYLFNLALDKINKPHEKIPILGFLTEFKNQEIKSIYEEILKQEGIVLKDFIIKQIPELSLEGNERKMFAVVKDFKILNFSKDELNPGKFKEIISFNLDKGSYATLVIKEMFS